MEDLIAMIANNESSSEVSDKIKELLYMKSAEKLENLKPQVAAGIFDDEE